MAAYLINERLKQVRAKNQELALEEQRRVMRDEYYRNLEAAQKEVRVLKHDMKHQLIALEAYAQADKGEAMQRQISDLYKEVEKSFLDSEEMPKSVGPDEKGGKR